MLVLTIKYYDGSAKAGHRIVCYEHLAAMYEIIDRSGLFLARDTDANTLLRETDEFLLHYIFCAPCIQMVIDTI